MSARFSEMLINRRRQMGMSVQQVANVIKIRPQILEYFETGDFANMPPRGYAQGMISSYARYLGLNPREVIDAYFDDLYEFERSSSDAYTGNYLDAANQVTPRRGDASGYAPPQSNLTGSRYGRRLPQAGYVSDRRPQGADTGQTRRMPRAMDPSMTNPGMTRQMPRQGRPGQGRPMPASGRGVPPRRPSQGSQRPQGDARSRGRGQSQSGLSALLSNPRILLGILAAVLLIIVLVVVLLVRSCSSGGGEEGASGTVPVTAASTQAASEPASAQTSTEPSTDASQPSTEAEQLPTEYQVVVSVADGESAWLEVKNGGKTVYADNVVGPQELNYTVTDTLEVSTSNVSAVTVTRDGERVDYDSESGGIGKITIVVPKPETDPATEGDGDESSTDESSDGDGSASASE